MCIDLQQWFPALWSKKTLLKLKRVHRPLPVPTMPMDPWPWQFLHSPHLKQGPGKITRILGWEETPWQG